jgi:hypothetical protein
LEKERFFECMVAQEYEEIMKNILDWGFFNTGIDVEPTPAIPFPKGSGERGDPPNPLEKGTKSRSGLKTETGLGRRRIRFQTSE